MRRSFLGETTKIIKHDFFFFKVEDSSLRCFSLWSNAALAARRAGSYSQQWPISCMHNFYTSRISSLTCQLPDIHLRITEGHFSKSRVTCKSNAERDLQLKNKETSPLCCGPTCVLHQHCWIPAVPHRSGIHNRCLFFYYLYGRLFSPLHLVFVSQSSPSPLSVICLSASRKYRNIEGYWMNFNFHPIHVNKEEKIWYVIYTYAQRSTTKCLLGAVNIQNLKIFNLRSREILEMLEWDNVWHSFEKCPINICIANYSSNHFNSTYVHVLNVCGTALSWLTCPKDLEYKADGVMKGHTKEARGLDAVWRMWRRRG